MSYKILAIDDSHTLRRFIENSLSQRSAEYEVTTAADGVQGLTKASEINPDLILLDFMLPDMNGDEVCNRLINERNLGHIPVIFMSSDAAEIKRVESEYGNVRRSLTKPFTQDLLCSTVSHAIHEIELSQVNNEPVPLAAPTSVPPRPPTHLIPPPPPVSTPLPVPAGLAAAGAPSDHLFRTSTVYTPLVTVLRGIENERLNGVLYCREGGNTTELHVLHGVPVVVTTPDADLYLASDLYQISIPDSVFVPVKAEQARTSCPSFAVLLNQEMLETEKALTLCKEYGNALFARLWTISRIELTFVESKTGPAWLSSFPEFKGKMDDWIMSTLRQVGAEYQSAQAWGQPNGVPCFTLRGYRTLQEVPLNDREIQFATLVGRGGLTLEEIAHEMEAPVESAERILFRFLTLEVIDYWPGSIFRRD